MSKETTFKPGFFSPVVEVSQRQTGVPAPADTSFAGLEEVSLTTLQVATASARGSGAYVTDAVPDSKVSKVIGYILALRNICEQLLFIGVHTRIATPARSPNGEFLEPFIRAYNFYGHFEHESKLYVTRGLERFLVYFLFQLRQNATTEVANGTRDTVTAPGALSDIDLDFYRLGPTGDVEFGKIFSLKEYIIHLVKYISDYGPLNERLPLLQQCLDITTEDGLANFLRHVRRLPNFTPPTREFVPNPTDKHKAAMKKLFGSEYSSPGDIIPVAKFTEAVSKAYQLLRRISLERSYGMKTIRFPKYEGGSASQLASYTDDVLHSTIPLSLTDSTAALAFTTSYGSFFRYNSAPGHERDELLRELVSQSIIRNNR